MNQRTPWRFYILPILIALGLSAQPIATAGEESSASLTRAITETRQDIDTASEQLAERRQQNTEHRLELAKRLAEMESRVAELRQEAAWALRRGDETDTRLATLRARDRDLSRQIDSVLAMLREGVRALDARSDIFEAKAYAKRMAKVQKAIDRAEKEHGRIPDAAQALLSEVLTRLERNGRIHAATGTAIQRDGTESAGTFLRLGSAQSFFLPEEASASPGIVYLEHGSPSPHVWPVHIETFRRDLQAVLSGEAAPLPLDPTGGGALRATESDRTWMELFQAGGVVMWPILAVGVFGLLVGLLKLVQLVRISTHFDGPLDRVVRLLFEGKEAEAKAFAESRGKPLRRLLLEGLEHRHASREDLEEMLHEAIIMEVPPLEKHLTILSVGAAVAPLLGLLGTVTGMISTFQLIAVFGTGDPRMLSGGISEALITTEAGLAVAIPLLLLHAFLSRRVAAIAEGLEKGALSFINTVKTREVARAGSPSEAGAKA